MKEIVLSEGRRIGVTSDTHYGHSNIIQYCLRPFMSPEEYAMVLMGEDARVEKGHPAKVKLSADSLARQNAALVDGINSVLGADDVLIHAGDVAWRDLATLQEFRDRLAVKEIYVAIGNHDVESELVQVFGRDRVFERFLVQVGRQRAVVDHYPGYSWQESHKATWLLFGHVHGAANAARKENPQYALSIDVGVDSHDFKPWLWTKLVDLFAARKPAFDRWCRKTYPGKEAGGMAPVGAP
jgi:calcineurin-like phosphoesterase family protein